MPSSLAGAADALAEVALAAQPVEVHQLIAAGVPLVIHASLYTLAGGDATIEGMPHFEPLTPRGPTALWAPSPTDPR